MRAVVGHQHAQALLVRAVMAEQVRHAYLLTGAEHVGKTTLAVEFAKLLQCQRRMATSDEPCGACDSCLRIAHGTHPDVTLVERPAGARTLPVELVREMIRVANLSPSVGPWRIFIVPEVERMLLPSANALLKTLEEPPPGVVLLLTSAEPESLLATIISRCQVIQLQPLRVEEVAQALEARWQAAPFAAREVATLANGRLGWAVAAHQQPALREQRAQELGQITPLLGATRDERLRQAAVFASDSESARRVLELWLLWWRDVALAAHGATSLSSVGFAREEAERQGAQLGPERARDFLHALLDAQVALEQNANARLTYDVLMLRLPLVGATPRAR